MGPSLEPFTVDIRLHGQESTLTVGDGAVRAIHCPGHSPGSVVIRPSLTINSSFSGRTSTARSILNGFPMRTQYLDSLARLLNLQADLLLEGHFGIIETKKEVRVYRGVEISAGSFSLRYFVRS